MGDFQMCWGAFVKVWTIQLIASDGETLGGPTRFLSLEEVGLGMKILPF